MNGLADELKMARGCGSLEEEATLAIWRTAEVLQEGASEVLKPFDITGGQYNVLRILKGSPGGLTCGEIGERMIHRDPDVTRLLDRMEARGWIARKRSEKDRRMVTTSLTCGGAALLEQIKTPLQTFHKRPFAGWSEKQLRQLLGLLELVRKPEESDKGETNHA